MLVTAILTLRWLTDWSKYGYSGYYYLWMGLHLLKAY